jgi:hypothetical protein
MFYKKQFLNFKNISKIYNNTHRKITTYNNPGGGNNNDILIVTLIVGFFMFYKNK